jgi:hypothetical protein
MDTIEVEVLGAGRVTAAVAAVRPLDWHGIPGLAWRLVVRLPDGSAVTAIAHRGGAPRFADPRVRAVAPVGRPAGVARTTPAGHTGIRGGA